MVHDHQQVFLTPRCFGKGAHIIHCSENERLTNLDVLQGGSVSGGIEFVLSTVWIRANEMGDAAFHHEPEKVIFCAQRILLDQDFLQKDCNECPEERTETVVKE